MSSNRLIYDEETYKTNLSQSVGPYAYTLDPVRYENCNKCRMELGVLAGTSVSHIKGNLVDLETELRGQNRNASLCPARHYMPPALTGDNSYSQPRSIKIKDEPNRVGRSINTNLTHLPSCQMVSYKPVPKEPKIKWETCQPNSS
jgi:hypothetical protein